MTRRPRFPGQRNERILATVWISLIALVMGVIEPSAAMAEEPALLGIKMPALLYPGTNYCGPGQADGRPRPRSPADAACQLHDDDDDAIERSGRENRRASSDRKFLGRLRRIERDARIAGAHRSEAGRIADIFQAVTGEVADDRDGASARSRRGGRARSSSRRR